MLLIFWVSRQWKPRGRVSRYGVIGAEQVPRGKEYFTYFCLLFSVDGWGGRKGVKNKTFIALIMPKDYYSKLFSCFSKRNKLHYKQFPDYHFPL